MSTLVREEEEAYHAEDIVYPLRRLAANEPDLDVSLVRQSSMYGEHLCSLTPPAEGASLSFRHGLLQCHCAVERLCPWTAWLLLQRQGLTRVAAGDPSGTHAFRMLRFCISHMGFGAECGLRAVLLLDQAAEHEGWSRVWLAAQLEAPCLACPLWRPWSCQTAPWGRLQSERGSQLLPPRREGTPR